ncbi:TonB-dependent copper receptor [Pseudoxanthomonas indica]|uniref:Iron complex outermembrane recepter protein n=1 Tax=Pseudoxanthomonas indica TaxID=428993 RepID=A0A1T5ILC4_9GAMM|nr:TonB-dependent copper receptor [Pseudoxanthomonas indica]GGD52864.1 copper transporter porin [Pseudoxanthomonas indica]SKC39872.1 iron complex outermembrane recepter protein [Pseudoxanthomonas indica]
MERHPLAVALAIALPWLMVSTAIAQPNDQSHEGHAAAATQLDGVVVIGVAPSLATTFVTDPKLPRQPVPASDGADYLKTIPGFSVLRSGGTNGDPVLRGMFGSRLNLLTNDGALSGACPSRMDNAMSYIAPETYDRLIVIKGPQSVLWGGGASAGTIRFEREVPYFDRPESRLSGSALMGSRNRNDQVVDAVFGRPQGYVRVAANRSESDDYQDGAGNEVPSAWRKWNADAAIGWTPDADTVLELSAGQGDAQARYAGRGMDGATFDRDSLGLRFEKKHMGGVLDALVANVYRNQVDHVMDNYSLRQPDPHSSMPMPMASNVAQDVQGGRVAATWQKDRWEITAGADLRDSRHSQRSAMGRGAYRLQPWTVDAKFQTYGVFAESHWHITEHHHLMSGLRLDRAEVQDLRKRTGGMMPMPNPTAGQRRQDTLPSGFVRYEYDHQGLGFHAGVGHTARMPDYWELFSATRGPVGAANAFAGVRPEKTTQLDIGAQYEGRQVDAWVSLYAGRVQDFVLFDYLSGGMGMKATRARNVDADIHGGEAGVEWRPGRGLKVGSVLAYAWGDLKNEGAMPQMPPLELRLSLAQERGKFSWGTLLRVVAQQDRVNPGTGNVVGQDLGPSAGFAVFSANAAYRYSERVQVSAGVDNLFDRDYSEHLNLGGNSAFGYPADPVRIHEPGRTLWLKVNLSY